MSRPQTGFTLVELIVAMSLSVIVIAFMTMFISTPVTAYQAQSRRADLVDSADSVLRFMAHDVRTALPNSVRTQPNGTIVALEMMNTLDGARYRSTGSTDPAKQNEELDFLSADTTFRTVGRFGARTTPGPPQSWYLAVYPVLANDIYATSGTPRVMTGLSQVAIAQSPDNPDEDEVTINPGFQFKYQSPSHRVYVVSGPVTYLCDTTAKTLQRYDGYAIALNQASRDTDGELMAAGARRSRIANDVSACTFDYTPGSPRRSALVTLSLTLTHTTQGNASESVRLLRQVHLENAP